MKRQLRLKSAALADLQAIWNFGAENWSAAPAENYARGLGQVFDLLCDQPMLARLRQEFTPPLRLYRYQSHVIVYDLNESDLIILRVVHSRAHWAEYLAD